MAGRVRPLGDRVLVREIPRERKTTGGVILPDQARERSDHGLVVSVGPGEDAPVPVSEGEVVLFSPYAGVRVARSNDDFLLLREHDILGVLDGVEVEEVDGKLEIKNEETVGVG